MNWLDIFIAIIAVYSIFNGYKSGLVKQLASLASIVACVLLSGKISTILLPYIVYFEFIPQHLGESFAFILSFAIIFGVFFALGYMLQNILQTVKLGKLNKLAGASLCLVKWMVIVSLVLNLFTRMDSHNLVVPPDIGSKCKSYRFVQPIATEITPYLKFNIQE